MRVILGHLLEAAMAHNVIKLIEAMPWTCLIGACLTMGLGLLSSVHGRSNREVLSMTERNRVIELVRMKDRDYLAALIQLQRQRGPCGTVNGVAISELIEQARKEL